MSDPEPTVDSILKSSGFSSSGIDRIKLGNGVVGKMTTTQMGLYVICFAGIGAGTWINNPYMIEGFVAVAFVSFLFSSIASMIFASNHPAVALLEGAELVKYRQIEMAAKDISIPSSQVNIEPTLITKAEELT
jgi:hypothetical protein